MTRDKVFQLLDILDRARLPADKTAFIRDTMAALESLTDGQYAQLRVKRRDSYRSARRLFWAMEEVEPFYSEFVRGGD